MDKIMQAQQAKHNLRIKNAKSKVDNKSPIIHSNNVLGINKLREDALNYMTMMKRNMQLLVNVTGTMRTLGKIDSFRAGILVPNNVGLRLRRMSAIEKENHRLGRRLINAQATLKIKPRKQIIRNVERRATMHVEFIYPRVILEKYQDMVKLPSNLELVKRYLRPSVYFDLEIKNVRPLGRIVIELYTEAAPQLVMEFIHMCQEHDLERFEITRIFPALWVEGKFLIKNTDMNNGLIEYDMRALDNGLCGGIFSFQLNEHRRPDFIFISLSFKPLAVVNGRRIAFARIKQGFRIVDCLQDLGTRNGKMTKDVIVVGCGMGS